LRVLLVSDVHGAFRALEKVAGQGEPLLILGDLVNLLDYRTHEGIIADVLGREFGGDIATFRAAGNYAGMRQAWTEVVGHRRTEVRAAIQNGVSAEYEKFRSALSGATGYCTYGNVDNPELLKANLPPSMRFVDGEAVEIGGRAFGFVGGGIATPMAGAGEVTDEEMEAKLAAMGPVDVLCSHLPPAVEQLCTDVITGRQERSSQPLLDYIRRHRPRRHFYGDVHQPQASRWRVGPTTCQNVGYFRATGRPIVYEW
jgi:Icc-related predicted phosphoesterase